jgi:hypothetical protein
MTLTDAQRQTLLTELREMGRASSAELESGKQFQRAFYPVAEHLRVFEPNVNLIIGYHGAGKSMLFKAAVEQQLSAKMIRKLPGRDLFLHTLAEEKASWLAGYPMGAAFPDPGTLRQFVQHLPAGRDNAQALADLWLAYLARLLRQELNVSDLQPLFELAATEVKPIYDTLQGQRATVIKALDVLDACLKRENRWVFINYDELDTLGGVDWELMADLIRGLLTFWSEYARRWQRIQPKIFLRSDLYTNTHVFAADLTKLAASRVELTWTDRNLYAMLIKRMANSSKAWLTYCRNAGLGFDHNERLGSIPRLPNVEAAQPLIEQIVGPFMGHTIKKGRTFTWVLDHLRDGRGHITPRNLVSLWGYAAAQELDAARAGEQHLLHPTSLRHALDQVSDEYVRLLKSREMPWLEALTRRLSQREVPMTRQEWEEILSQDWSAWRDDPQEKQRPPRKTPAEFLDFLLELGVCRTRPDDRIDVPDLFLHGLGTKRRGGVKQ